VGNNSAEVTGILGVCEFLRVRGMVESLNTALLNPHYLSVVNLKPLHSVGFNISALECGEGAK
jgi:hypothetical protein